MRSLAEHISAQELANLPASQEELDSSESDSSELSLHLRQCEACHSLAQTYWTLRSPTSGFSRTPATPLEACPPSSAWLALAAGINPDQSLLPHAACCSDCADLLYEALHLMQDQIDLPERETEQIEGLASATPAWQQSMAARMKAAAAQPGVSTPSVPPFETAHTPSKITPIRRRVPVWLALAAAILLAAVLGGTALYRSLHPSDSRLLALAYDKNRLSELRIPGARAVDLYSPTRAASAPHATSTELLQLKLHAQQQFEQTPNDPHIRQELGEIAVVEHDGETARRQFEMAEALDPTLPRLKFDLGTAYFVLAESGTHPLDYARAIDFFGQYLQSVDQKDPVALFDRGLCWERNSVDTEAIKDFQAALALEKDPAWRAEIQRHLTRLKAETSLDGTDSSPPPALTPASFLALKSESPGDYENYLDIAGREWLPTAPTRKPLKPSSN